MLVYYKADIIIICLNGANSCLFGLEQQSLTCSLIFDSCLWSGMLKCQMQVVVICGHMYFNCIMGSVHSN